MRKVTISVHNNQTLEVFVENLKRGFAIWVVGPVKGRRTILDHHLTHDDLETHLEYAKAGDLVWRDANQSEIPTAKHPNAIEMEKTIGSRTFWDYDNPKIGEMELSVRQRLKESNGEDYDETAVKRSIEQARSVTQHLSSIAFLRNNKSQIGSARQHMFGRWTDGVVTLKLGPNHKLQWSCTDRRHPLNVGEQVHKHAPDWWNFAVWGIALLNNEHKCGTTVGVLRVNEEELHLSSNHPHRIADVFRRIGQPEGVTVQKSEAAKSKKVKHIRGIATPRLRRLEQAIARRSPLLANGLKPGLSESDIRTALNKAKVTGAIEPIIEFYSWRNGMALTEQTPIAETNFFPADIYQFLDLETAIGQWKSLNEAARQLREMCEGTKARSLFSGITDSLFPIFNDGATGTIAIDLTPAKRNRVVAVEFESTEPVRLAYDSFDEFIKDAIRANNDGDGLSCFEAA